MIRSSHIADVSSDSARWLIVTVQVVLAGYMQIAASYWDLEVHMVGGREGLFTPPHLTIMAGAIICAVMAWSVSRYTQLYRAHDQEAVRYARMVFWAVSVQFICFGLDEIWHRSFGPDSFIWSPPHIAIITGCAVSMLAFAKLAARLTHEPVSTLVSGALRGIALFTWLFLISEAEFPHEHTSTGLWSFHSDGTVHPHISPPYAMLLIGPFVLFILGLVGEREDRRRWATEVFTVVLTYTVARWLTLGLLTFTPLPPVGPPLVILAVIPFVLARFGNLPRLTGAALFLPVLWAAELTFGTHFAGGIATASRWGLAIAWLASLGAYQLAHRLTARQTAMPTQEPKSDVWKAPPEPVDM